MISEEIIEEMKYCFLSETNDEDTRDWREDLSEEEEQMVDDWDNNISEGFANIYTELNRLINKN